MPSPGTSADLFSMLQYNPDVSPGVQQVFEEYSYIETSDQETGTSQSTTQSQQLESKSDKSTGSEETSGTQTPKKKHKKE